MYPRFERALTLNGEGMARNTIASALILFSLLAGCAAPYSEVPFAGNFPPSVQPKLQATSHWNAIAIDVAKQISARFRDRPPLYVNQSAAGTAFDRAFYNQLISTLVADGFTVLKNPESALNVEIDTQTVRFTASRSQMRYATPPTAMAEFGISGTPQTEIIVTLSVGNERQYVTRSTNSYYVTDYDGRLYMPLPARARVQTRNMEVTGP